MNLSRIAICALLLATTASALIAQEESPAEYGPYSPEEAAKRFVLHPDCKIELVAAEPDVIDPVHIAFNTDGKMWVVEYTDYPNGPGDGQPGLSRIRVLSDDDGDGRYNNPVTFAEKLLFANGLMFWKDGVIVTTDGKIQFMRDTDGDGKSDETQVWFQGFATKNPQLRHNHPQLAMDCKIYVANGLRGGDIVPGPDNPWGLDPKAKPLSISGRDFRFDPLTGEYEAIAGMGQFGMTFDQFGNRFVCTNRNPCRQIVLEDEQLKLTPGLRIPRFYEDVAAAGEDSKLYPLSRTWTTSNLHANQFTAACGVLIYNDLALGLGFVGNSFTCDPTANLVHREILKRSGPTFVGKPARDGVEFLATQDEWFRPVNLSHGPDGSLFVVDMYRAVIEHPQFMPTELKERPDLLMGTDRGRIWRVSSKHQVKVNDHKQYDLQPVSTEKLISNFSLFSGDFRHGYSQRLLLENKNERVIQQLRAALANDQSIIGSYVLHLLNAFGELTLDDLQNAYNNSALELVGPSIINLGARNFSGDPRLLEFTKSPDDILQPIHFEKFDLLFPTLGSIPWIDIPERDQRELLNTICARTAVLHPQHVAPEWASTYLGICAREHSLDLCTKLIEQSTYDIVNDSIIESAQERSYFSIVNPIIHDAAELVARQNQPGQAKALLEKAFQENFAALPIRLGVLAGMADGLPSGRAMLLKTISELPEGIQSNAKDTIASAARLFETSGSSPIMEPIILTVLSLADDDNSLKQLVTATGSGNATRASLALSALLKRPAEQVNPALVELLPKRRGSVRRSILQAMASNVSRAPALLDEIEAGRVPPLEIDATMEKMFYRLSDKEIVARAKKLLKRAPPADRVKVLADYQEVLKMDSDPLRGKVVFEKNCATCHKVGDVGVNVAPDISDSRTKTPDFYLMNILDPNRAIDANYFSFNILDTDGKVHTGIVASETSSAVTLKMPEGKLVTIDREEIELFKNNGVSLMPVGLERTINKQQMADVISFIKNWRYLDGQIPKEVIK